MNELIKRLELEAYIKTEQEWIDPSNNMPYRVLANEFNREHFAQLVAAECARIAATVASSYLTRRRQADDFVEKNVLAEDQAAAEEVQMRILAEFDVADSTHPKS